LGLRSERKGLRSYAITVQTLKNAKKGQLGKEDVNTPVAKSEDSQNNFDIHSGFNVGSKSNPRNLIQGGGVLIIKVWETATKV